MTYNRQALIWDILPAESLSIYIKSSKVQLKVEEDTPYTWHIEDPSLEPLFSKQLSKHSVSVYMQLYAKVGHSFWAIHADTPTSVSTPYNLSRPQLTIYIQTTQGPSLDEQIKVLQSENTVLLEELQIAK
jgi:hypothetical protein